MDAADIERRFSYHPPLRPAVADTHTLIRDRCAHLGFVLNQVLPESREKSLAITHLEEAMMWANAAVARVLNYTDPSEPAGP